jgi:hypothetical protein
VHGGGIDSPREVTKMNDTSSAESARTSKEARDAIVSRPRGSRGSALDEALRRYLTAETADELKRLEQDSEEEKPH